MKAVRIRLDQLLVERGLFESRERARAAVMAGRVRVFGRVADKPGLLVDRDAEVAMSGPAHPYASRGGLKLAHALAAFAIDPTGWTVADIGASTGGFTDCWLQHGASRVYSVDVGRGQLLPRLANDPRVTVLDRLNARTLTLAHVGGTPVDGASIDVSFIGLELVLPAVAAVTRDGGALIALVKPQFEVGPKRVGKGGIVRDPALHRAVLSRLVAFGPSVGLGPVAVTASPIRGQEGNREFLLLYRKGELARAIDLDAVVAAPDPADPPRPGKEERRGDAGHLAQS